VKSQMHRPGVEFDGAPYVTVFGTCPKHLLNTADITSNQGKGGEVCEAEHLCGITW
jgi:hypothetical protein